MRAGRKIDKSSILFAIIISVILGSFSGSLIANRMDNFSLDKINVSIENFFVRSDNSFDRIELFTSEFFKNGKVAVFLWFMAFIPFGKLFLMLLLFLKGLSYGFTSSIFFSLYKSKGVLYIAKYLIPQNFILLPVFIFISVCSFNYVNRIHIKRKNDYHNLLEYLFVLLISLACVFLSSLIEIYLFV